MISMTLKCPQCGSNEIDYYDCYDTESYGDEIVQSWSGCCMQCRAPLCWEEIFIFDRVNNIRIMED